MQTELDRVTDDLRAVVSQQQRNADPAHEDFYAWGWALSELTAGVQGAGGVLGRQVTAYGNRRVLRDDDGADPYGRLAEACGHLEAMGVALAEANAAARLFHSAIGHVAVAVDPEVQA